MSERRWIEIGFTVATLLTVMTPTVSAVDFSSVLNTNARAWADYNKDGYSDLFAKSTYWTNDYATTPDTFTEHTAAL